VLTRLLAASSSPGSPSSRLAPSDRAGCIGIGALDGRNPCLAAASIVLIDIDDAPIAE
jgi:hypothetical protein